jgi:hypothetical protein
VHIAFLTLFLGLVAGRVPVELTVSGSTLASPAAPATPGTPGTPGIAAIELVLDGRTARGIAGPPWKCEIDLGKDLLPHHLEARGLDATGVEVARAEQWINLPQPAAIVDLLPEPGPGGRIAAARLSFRSRTYEAPTAVTATLDGAPLPVEGGRVTLPAYRPDLPHLLTIEAQFPTGAVHRDLAFGGGLAGEVATELTAVAIRTRGPLPTVAALAGRFIANGRAWGKPLTPVAVEEGPGEILIVRDPGAPAALVKLGEKESYSSSHHDNSWLQSSLPIEERDRVRFVDAGANWFSGDGMTSATFDVSPELDGQRWGLYWWLAHANPTHPDAPTHLADAVAVAGVRALTDQHRRAVLLVLSGEPADGSRWGAAAVRRYLAAIRVPLYVWSLRPPPYSTAVTAWGKVEDASTLFQMARAYHRLGRDLAAQRIVWLDGRHLPQSISLSPNAANTAKTRKGIELVAGPEP